MGNQHLRARNDDLEGGNRHGLNARKWSSNFQKNKKLLLGKMYNEDIIYYHLLFHKLCILVPRRVYVYILFVCI